MYRRVTPEQDSREVTKSEVDDVYKNCLDPSPFESVSEKCPSPY